MSERYQTQRVLWRCSSCDLWWLSEPRATYRWHLSRLTAIENIALQMAEALVWNVCGPAPNVCPECGDIMIEQPESLTEPI